MHQENNIYWEDFVNDKVISIGWKIGDLNNFVTKEEIKAELIKQYPENRPSNNVLACYEFGHVISISDYVYVKRIKKNYCCWKSY